MAVSEWKNPPSQKIVETKGYAKSRMCRKETHYPICRKFCMVVGSTNIITCANSGYDRLRGFWVAGVKFLHSP